MFSLRLPLPSSSKGQGYHLFTFLCLYLAQALPMTFFSTALQVTMRQASFSLSSIALLQLVKLPWILKFLWSPMVDRYCNSMKAFRRCIFMSEAVYAVLILLVGHLNLQTHFYWIVGIIFLSLIASATQDIATDALAVLCFERRDKGLVNSMQSLGSFAATLLGSGLLLVLLQRYGWHYVLPFLSIFVLLAVIPLWRNRSLTLLPQPETSSPVSKADFLWFFTRRSIWRQIGFLVLYYAGIIGSLAMFRPYMVDLGYTMHEIGLMSGIGGAGAACIASLLGGQLLHRWGRFVARRFVACCSLLTTLYLYLMSMEAPTFTPLLIGIMLVWICYGMGSVIVYTTAMDYVRPGREGTDFTVQTVITHLSGMLIALASGRVADLLGYNSLFLFESLIATLSLLYVFMLFPKEKD